MSVSNIEVDFEASTSEHIRFPARPLLYVDDAIEISRKDAEAHGKEGIADAVFFSFTTLHEILEAGKKKLEGDSWRLNSRILMASLAEKQSLKLKNPARIYLRHLDGVEMTDPVCVHWDTKNHLW